MAVSAEVRWFWEGDAPAALTSWFEAGPIRPGGKAERTDVYLREPHREVGIKTRGGRPVDKKKGAEVKSLVDTIGGLELGGLRADIEIWTKWTVESIHLDRVRSIATRKARRLRKFDTIGGAIREIALGEDEQPLELALPAEGCNVEITRVRVAEGERLWTTLGFEAFGSLGTVEQSLRRTVEHVAPGFPELPSAVSQSYPAWLDSIGMLAQRIDPDVFEAVLEHEQADAEQRKQRFPGGKVSPVEWKEFEG